MGLATGVQPADPPPSPVAGGGEGEGGGGDGEDGGGQGSLSTEKLQVALLLDAGHAPLPGQLQLQRFSVVPSG